MGTILPLKWHGGKQYLAEWVLEHRPADYITYCEPFFGGGAVLFKHNGEGKSEVVNDLNGQLMNFWHVLADPELFEQFRHRCSMTPFAQIVFEGAPEIIGLDVHRDTDDRVSNALLFFIHYRQSRQGLGKSFATMSKSRTRRGMNEQVASWLGAIEGLPEAHARIKRVAILNDDALKVIRAMDHVKTWFYLDPPYLHATRSATIAYEHECDEDFHIELLETLASLDGMFTLSGYPSDLYNGVAADLGWRCVSREQALHSSSKATKETKTECLWMNY